MLDRIMLSPGMYGGTHTRHSHNLQKEIDLQCEFTRFGSAGFFQGSDLLVKISNNGILIQLKIDGSLRQAIIELDSLNVCYFCAEVSVFFFTILPNHSAQFIQALHLPPNSLCPGTGEDQIDDLVVLRFSRPLSDLEVGYMSAFSSRINGHGQAGQFSMPICRDTAIGLLGQCGARLDDADSSWMLPPRMTEKSDSKPMTPALSKSKRISLLPCTPPLSSDDPPLRNKRLCLSQPKSYNQQGSILQKLLNEQEVSSRERTRSSNGKLIGRATAAVLSLSAAANGEEQEPLSSSKDDPIEKRVQPRFTQPVIRDFTYRPQGSDGIKLTNDDIFSLNFGEFLNDVIINFYLKYLVHEVIGETDRQRTHVFNTFFYTHLSSELTEKNITNAEQMRLRHAKVSKWTKRVDIFEKDFVIIPMNEDQHWFLAIVCFPWLVGSVNYRKLFNTRTSLDSFATVPVPDQNTKEGVYAATRSATVFKIQETSSIQPMPCILLFDSLFGTMRSPNVKVIRDYLQAEWDEKQSQDKGFLVFSKDTIRGFCPHVPQQPNHYDCGLYALHYAETFFKKPVTSFTKNYFQDKLNDWFLTSDIDGKRADIQDLIIAKYRSQK